MTSRQIEIIENSWDMVLLYPEEASEMFYERLFFLNPKLRPLFKEDISSQAQKLISTITFIVHKLHDLDEILEDVRELGVRHQRYNVKPEDFITVASALLWTLESRLGNLWDTETKEAWITIYSTLSNTMIDAMTKAQSTVLQ